MRREEHLRTLEGHWDSLTVMLSRLDLSESEKRNMKRAFYAGAVSMLTVLRTRIGDLDHEPTDDESSALIQELTKEALTGMVNTVTGG